MRVEERGKGAKCLLQREIGAQGERCLQETDISSIRGEESFQGTGGGRWEFAYGSEFQKALGGQEGWDGRSDHRCIEHHGGECPRGRR